MVPGIELRNTYSGNTGTIRFTTIADGAGGNITFAGSETAASGEIPSTMTSNHAVRYQGGFGFKASTTATASKFWFGTATPGTNQAVTQRFTILADGNVGIGTTSPNSSLEVNGILRIFDSAQGQGNLSALNTKEENFLVIVINLLTK